MGRYVAHRLVAAVPLLLGISVVTFAILRAVPGGPLAMYSEDPSFRPEDLERLERSLGLDQPLAAVLASTPCRWHPVAPRQQRWLEALWSRRSLGRVALLLLEAAAFRQESRGGHHRVDAPSPQPFWQRHTLQQRGRAIHSGPVV